LANIFTNIEGFPVTGEIRGTNWETHDEEREESLPPKNFYLWEGREMGAGKKNTICDFSSKAG